MPNRYYRFFIILTIYNGNSDIDVFWHKLNTYSTAEKIHPLVTTDQQTQRVYHRFLSIDQCNRYQSNQIYRFLSIDYSGSSPAWYEHLFTLPRRAAQKPVRYVTINFQELPGAAPVRPLFTLLSQELLGNDRSYV